MLLRKLEGHDNFKDSFDSFKRKALYTDIAKSWIYTQHNVIMDNTLEFDGTVETVKATQS